MKLESKWFVWAVPIALAFATPAMAQNSCGNEGTAPQIATAQPVSPPTLSPGGSAPPNWNPANARLTRNGITYLAANFVRMRVITDPCTTIAGVRYGTRVVTPNFDQGYWYAVLSSTPPPADPTQIGWDVTVFFPAQSDGATETLTIAVGRQGSTLVTETRLILVRVKAVEAADATAPLGFSRTEIFNMFGKALADKFGAANSTWITSAADGSRRRIYNYDPNSLVVSVNSTGVMFQFKFKTDIPYWCDPTVRAFGTFKLNADVSGVSVDWVNPAQGSLTWPSLCQAVQLIPILGLVPTLVQDVIEDRHAGGIAASVEEAALGFAPDSEQARFFLAGSSTRNNELLVHLRMGVPSVAIQAPYDAFDLPRGASAFPPGERLLLAASGLGMSDFVAGAIPPTTLLSGPHGVPRNGSTYWVNALTVDRPGTLVWNAHPVARLLARSYPSALTSRTHRYAPGCTVHATTQSFFNWPAWVRFGVNDTAADAQRLRNNAATGYHVRAFFLNDAPQVVIDNASACQFFDSGPVTGAVSREP
jgi:hypothetical protein